MSRIGNKPVMLEGATFERVGNLVKVSGPKGTLEQEIDKNTLMLIAARTPDTNTRLIDNILLWE